MQLPLALPPPRGKRKSSSSRPQSEECLEDLPVQPPFALPWLQSVELPPPPGSRVRNVSRICKCNLPLECLPSEENGNPLHLHCGGKRKSSVSKPQSEDCLKTCLCSLPSHCLLSEENGNPRPAGPRVRNVSLSLLPVLDNQQLLC